jgi:hypothetical protein
MPGAVADGDDLNDIPSNPVPDQIRGNGREFTAAMSDGPSSIRSV